MPEVCVIHFICILNFLGFRACSHCAIYDCDLVFFNMGCIGVGDVVPVAQCEHFHGVLCNQFVAIRGIAVAIR